MKILDKIGIYTGDFIVFDGLPFVKTEMFSRNDINDLTELLNNQAPSIFNKESFGINKIMHCFDHNKNKCNKVMATLLLIKTIDNKYVFKRVGDNQICAVSDISNISEMK